MNLLVTGAAGFIGSNYVRNRVQEHPDDLVVAVDALTYAGDVRSLADLEGRHVFVHGDIGDTEHMAAVMQEHDIEVVVNFAAESHNSLAIVDPGRFFRTNVLGTQGLLEASRRVGLTRFHHVSTCEVYGDLPLEGDPLTDGTAFTEDSPYRPRTPYNASKAGADHAVRAYSETFGLPISITNCANNYGTHQFPEKVIPLFTTRALQGLSLPLYTSSKNQREWIHAIDHCRAIDLVIEQGREGATYHVGTGLERTVTEIADAVLDALGAPQSLKETVPDRPGHDRRYVLDSSLIRDELGWKPTIDFAQGLADTVAWYADNRAWWEPLLGRAPVAESTAWAG
ncbi:MAG: dTDP-glucose 4,6-dehydratase [Acidimicrobiales bacterium]|nr:dTDP-glucose 4,6-dehydratase [Acidimicrobiales bacterium]